MAFNGSSFGAGKGYTNLVALGLSDVTVEGTTVTFTLTDGETASVTLPTPSNGEDGADGVSITSVEQTDSRHFRCVFSNGTKSELITLPVGQGSAYDDTEIKEEIAELTEKVEEAEEIAKGRNKGYVFDTVEALDIWLSDEDNVSQLIIGDNFYIKAVDVPDYWWDGTQKQQLETQKVDLTEYPTKTFVSETYQSKADMSSYATKSYVDEHSGGGNTYSTDEVCIGTWIDGKPIYRKVFSASDFSVTSTFSANEVADIAELNIENVTKMYGTAFWSSSNDVITLPYTLFNTTNNYAYIMLRIVNGKLRIEAFKYSGSQSVSNAKIVLEYTKTTD